MRVGMEAIGYSRWFERLLAELGFRTWIGDPAEIKAKRVQEGRRPTARGPAAAAMAPASVRADAHAEIMNQLQALAMNEGEAQKDKALERSRSD